MKIQQGDTVLVISGKDKGKKGTVLRVLHEKNRVIVGGVNMRTKFNKKTAQGPGSKIQFEAGLSAANVMILDPKTGKPTRMGYKIDEKTGRKVRYAKVSGTIIGRTSAKAEKPATEKKETTKTTATKKKSVKSEQEKAADEVISQKPARAPFWKKIGFGADAMNNEPDAQAEAGPDFNTPAKSQQHSRGGTRGS